MPVLPEAGAAQLAWTDYVVAFGGPSVLMLALMLLLPVFHAAVLRRGLRPGWPRGVALCVVALAAVVATHADLLWQARHMAGLCAAAGEVQVYATAVADGFAGNVDLEPWLPAGFRFIEHPGPRPRRTALHEGKVRTLPVQSLEARHEIVTVTERPEGAFQRLRLQMRDRHSAKVLGEIVSYRLRPGWVDRALMQVLGSPQLPMCVGPHRGLPSDFPFLEDALIAATLRPPGFPPPHPPHRGPASPAYAGLRP